MFLVILRIFICLIAESITMIILLNVEYKSNNQHIHITGGIKKKKKKNKNFLFLCRVI